MKSYLKVEELKDGFLYRINARNARFGIWNSKNNSFFISRIKFGDNFIFEEIHYDKDDSFGTVKPLKEVEKSPFKSDDIRLRIFTDEQNEKYIKYPNENKILEYLNKFENRSERVIKNGR